MQYITAIGQGGFGNVDLVRDVDGREWARKTFSINQPNGFPVDLVENVKRRFVREARVQASISHNNIMPVVGLAIELDPPHFFMPVASSSLDKDIRKSKSLSGNFIPAIMDIISGLEELHSQGITHRDLKPQNVLHLNVPTSRYVISDFGLMSVKDTQLSVLTQTGMRMGSDYYTAPEIVSELKYASHLSDIYSVGCILHDFVSQTNRIPCGEISEQGEWAGILRGCTRRDPSRRFQSVSSLRDAILEVGRNHTAPTQQLVADYIGLVSGDAQQSVTTWKSIVDKIEDDIESPDVRLLLDAISIGKISEVIALDSGLAARLGVQYAAWVGTTAFNFERCDGIAARLSQFLCLSDVTCRADVVLALLAMGTSHNRWYVERRFMEACGPTMDDALAKRIATEVRVMGGDICHMIKHLEQSISVSRKSLHPLVANALAQVCT